jgi:predicted DNA-binding antitoxin AbrB/MazE fold protein
VAIKAKYESGVFKPLGVVDIKEGTIVDVPLPHEEKRNPSSIRDLGPPACGLTGTTSRTA